METIEQVDLQKFTILPLKTVNVAGKMLPDVLVKTPHKGNVNITLKKEHYPFIFGSVTQTEKHAGEIIKEILKLERESCEYLVEQWILSTNSKK